MIKPIIAIILIAISANTMALSPGALKAIELGILKKEDIETFKRDVEIALKQQKAADSSSKTISTAIGVTQLLTGDLSGAATTTAYANTRHLKTLINLTSTIWIPLKTDKDKSKYKKIIKKEFKRTYQKMFDAYKKEGRKVMEKPLLTGFLGVKNSYGDASGISVYSKETDCASIYTLFKPEPTKKGKSRCGFRFKVEDYKAEHGYLKITTRFRQMFAEPLSLSAFDNDVVVFIDWAGVFYQGGLLYPFNEYRQAIGLKSL